MTSQNSPFPGLKQRLCIWFQFYAQNAFFLPSNRECLFHMRDFSGLDFFWAQVDAFPYILSGQRPRMMGKRYISKCNGVCRALWFLRSLVCYVVETHRNQLVNTYLIYLVCQYCNDISLQDALVFWFQHLRQFYKEKRGNDRWMHGLDTRRRIVSKTCFA